MAWTWKYETIAGHTATESPSFPAQADAETWIGETWQELLDGGVESVTLLEDEREVYGPMGLRPPE
jgi:hypothetical protein